MSKENLSKQDFFNIFFKTNSEASILDFLNASSYDALGEIDLSKDELNIIYTVEGKYFAPFFDGSFTSLYDFTSENVVHPDDVVIYQELMEPKTLLQRLQSSPTKNLIHSELRYKLQDGTYRWVEQFVIAGEENDLREGIVRFYVLDINNRKNREEGKKKGDDNLIPHERNALTRLYTEKFFFIHATEKVKKEPNKKWCFISIDIEHFRLFDEWYGRKAGDYLISHIGIIISDLEVQYGAVGGFFGQDDFAILIPYDEKVINSLFDKIRSYTISFGTSVGFMPAFGICMIDGIDTIMETFSHASVACFYAKSDIKKRIYLYDNNMHSKTEQEYRILIDFIEALKNHEISFHLQPQYHSKTRRIVGAESLARWQKDGVYISPVEFIPVLEKYGFVTDLDKYIWEEVCKYLRKWIDSGHIAVPISVNVSQVDIFTIDVAEYFSELVAKYNLPTNIIKIEITESAYAEETNEVKEVVKKLRSAGFIVIMDDFGSGYSSLNMLSNINIDVIKLDAKFLNIGNELSRGLHILESIVSMTKIIAVPIIVEGVETKEQCDFLEGLGCNYIQGYYFNRPMPPADFEKLIADEKMIDKSGFVVSTNQEISIREFLDKNIYSDSMLNNIIGAVAFYSWHDNDVDIVRFNQQFADSVNVKNINERLLAIQKYLPDEDKPLLLKTLQQAVDNRLTGAQGVFRFMRDDAVYSWFMIHFYYIGDQGNEKRFYGSASNITAYATLQQQMNIISKFSSDCIIFLHIIDSDWIYQVSSHGLQKEMGLTREQIEEELNSGKFMERMDPAVAPLFRDYAISSFRERNSFTFNFRIKNNDDKYVELRMRGDPVEDEISSVEYIITVSLR